ncbi:MAG: hypothetical protein MUC36_19545 [Planctomycetes bacterium]|jgi:hypothetical protein|nr:hypothetical protein [Planctomycetota bacterium]
MTSELDKARATLAEVVLGDLSDRSPQWQQTVAAFPELAAELQQLRAMQRVIDWSDVDAEPVAREAAAQRTRADRQLVERRLRSEMGPKARSSAVWRWRWPLVLAAAALLVTLVMRILPGANRPAQDGYLGGQTPAAGAPRIVLEEGRLQPRNFDGLASKRWEFVLFVDGVERARDDYQSVPVQLPAEWLQLVDRGQRAEVRVLLDDRRLVVPVAR